MFCQNCGKEINDNDTFCGYCGAKIVSSNNYNKEQQYNSANNQGMSYNNMNGQNIPYNNGSNMNGQNMPYNNQYMNGQNPNYGQNYVQNRKTFSETVFGKLIVNYFKKPLSVFSVMKGEDTIKVSAILAVVMPIIYGCFHMLYFISFFKNLVNNLAYYINNILKSASNGLGSGFGVKYKPSDFLDISDSISKIKDKVQTSISSNMECSDYFFKGILVMFLIMLIAFITIEICNAILLKNTISQKDILLLATVGFIPLLLALIINNVVIYISFIATLCIFALGLIMSLITIFSGVVQLSNESRERAYITVLINNIVLVAAMPFIINIGINSVMETISIVLSVVCKGL